ncbi:unnamed protein product [Diamesa serratosioi]
MRQILLYATVLQIIINGSIQLSNANDVADDTMEDYQPHHDIIDVLGREKRSASYKVLESPGLRSHFHIDNVPSDEKLKIHLKRQRFRRDLEEKRKTELHSDEIEDNDSEQRQTITADDISVEKLPNAAKQTMNPAYYRTDEDRLMDKWVKSPYGEFQSRTQKDEDDSQPEATSNVGVKARTPRVNFITQQGQNSNNKDDKDGPEAREREREQEQQNNNNNKQNTDDGYRKPSDNRYYSNNNNNNQNNNNMNNKKNYDPYYQEREMYNPRDYPQQYGYDKYDPYDRRYEMNMMSQNGMARMPQYMNRYDNYRPHYNDYNDYYSRTIPNNYYSDKRYDFPAPMMPMEPRDDYLARPYLNSNDVNGLYNNRNTGRIIYYANLPEVVRSPPSDQRYRTVSNRYDPMYNYYYNNNYDNDYRPTRTVKSAPLREATDAMKVTSSPLPVKIEERSSYQSRPPVNRPQSYYRY